MRIPKLNELQPGDELFNRVKKEGMRSVVAVRSADLRIVYFAWGSNKNGTISAMQRIGG
jgi:hypothetical protein